MYILLIHKYLTIIKNIMKNYWKLNLILVLLPTIGISQQLKDGTNLDEMPDIKYVSVNYTLDGLSYKLQVNYGESISPALDDSGKPFKAKYPPATMNYMDAKGWNLVDTYQEVDAVRSKSVAGRVLSYNTVMIFKRKEN